MPVFRKDPCGILTVLFAYLAFAYADYVVVMWLVLRTLNTSLWGAVHAVIFNICIFMGLLAHGRAMLSDPGVVPRPQDKDRASLQPSPPQEGSAVSADPTVSETLYDFSGVYLGVYPRTRVSQSGESAKTWTVCRRCDMYRPPRAHHCRICQACIRKMDHHCPWINNCVGALNQKYFLQFLFWVAVTSIYAGSLTIYSWIHDCTECDQSAPVKQSLLMHTVILIVETSLFGIFVCVMAFDQLSAVFKDETGIESLNRAGPYRGHSDPKHLLRETCGNGSAVCWLCPCQSLDLNVSDVAGERMVPTTSLIV